MLAGARADVAFAFVIGKVADERIPPWSQADGGAGCLQLGEPGRGPVQRAAHVLVDESRGSERTAGGVPPRWSGPSILALKDRSGSVSRHWTPSGTPSKVIEVLGSAGR